MYAWFKNNQDLCLRNLDFFLEIFTVEVQRIKE